MKKCIICKTEIDKYSTNSIAPLNFAFSDEERIQLEKDDKLICCDKCNKLHIIPIRNMLHACDIPWNQKNVFKESQVAKTLMELQEIYMI